MSFGDNYICDVRTISNIETSLFDLFHFEINYLKMTTVDFLLVSFATFDSFSNVTKLSFQNLFPFFFSVNSYE